MCALIHCHQIIRLSALPAIETAYSRVIGSYIGFPKEIEDKYFINFYIIRPYFFFFSFLFFKKKIHTEQQFVFC